RRLRNLGTSLVPSTGSIAIGSTNMISGIHCAHATWHQRPVVVLLWQKKQKREKRRGEGKKGHGEQGEVVIAKPGQYSGMRTGQPQSTTLEGAASARAQHTGHVFVCGAAPPAQPAAPGLVLVLQYHAEIRQRAHCSPPRRTSRGVCAW